LQSNNQSIRESVGAGGLKQPKPIVHALLFGRELDEARDTTLEYQTAADVPPQPPTANPHLRSDM
jgi:hypothetical protein